MFADSSRLPTISGSCLCCAFVILVMSLKDLCERIRLARVLKHRIASSELSRFRTDHWGVFKRPGNVCLACVARNAIVVCTGIRSPSWLPKRPSLRVRERQALSQTAQVKIGTNEKTERSARRARQDCKIARLWKRRGW